MTDAVLDEWTLDTRRDCLKHCIDQLVESAPRHEDKAWLQEWGNVLRDQQGIADNPYNLYSRPFWGPMKEKGYAKSELLKLCRENERQKRSRMVIAAYIYKEELQMVAVSARTPPEVLMEHLDLLFEVLDVNPNLHSALHNTDTTGCWAVTETEIATSTMTTISSIDETSIYPQ
ncbi:hypothetical protein PHMEG_0007683 [Phytophthora megakarya]|uniref:Uncharacterized protein n=1 Tax=Phytophthora megakarya TaxID=4795 RepID=A0A225WKK7_9STRA|nr:hypothetical protein PHMEG_0007683 [Phytophthora megakarya]